MKGMLQNCVALARSSVYWSGILESREASEGADRDNETMEDIDERTR